MKYTITYSKHFEKDYARCKKRGYNLSLLQQVVSLLAETGTLPAKYKPHKLTGKYKGLWECHLQPDWLLVWQQNDTELILLFTNTGTHADLFK
ncbi:MAG: type II toxin-antitoxin system YafQ family toxin [Paludibacteraceae bacterium]